MVRFRQRKFTHKTILLTPKIHAYTFLKLDEPLADRLIFIKTKQQQNSTVLHHRDEGMSFSAVLLL